MSGIKPKLLWVKTGVSVMGSKPQNGDNIILFINKPLYTLAHLAERSERREVFIKSNFKEFLKCELGIPKK